MNKIIKLIIAIFMIMSIMTTGIAASYEELPSSEAVKTPLISENSFNTENLNSDMGYFALNDTGKLEGIKNIKETKIHLPLYLSNQTKVEGIYSDGTVLRVIGLTKFEIIEDIPIGMVPLQVEIYINPLYVNLVKAIVAERAGEFNNANIIAATLWREKEYVGHIFYTSASQKIEVGYITFENNTHLTLYMGDFNKDGCYELGFAVHKN